MWRLFRAPASYCGDILHGKHVMLKHGITTKAVSKVYDEEE